MLLQHVRQHVYDLLPEGRQELLDWLATLMNKRANDCLTPSPDPISKVITNTALYQLERIKCGKPTCHCNAGLGHGPYWYRYYSVKGKQKSEYVGKILTIK
jgi:hypothetical protein